MSNWIAPHYRVRSRAMAIFMTAAAATMLLLTIYGLAAIGLRGAVGFVGVALLASSAMREWRARHDEVVAAEEFDMSVIRNG